MAQFLRPAEDIQNTDWATSPTPDQAAYLQINETTPNLTTQAYIFGSTANPLEVRLSSATDPNVSTGHIVRVTAASDINAGAAAERHTVLLIQESTTIATVINNATLQRSTNPSTTTYTLTEAEANSISNYGDLRLHFQATTLGASELYIVMWAEMEVPDAASISRRIFVI